MKSIFKILLYLYFLFINLIVFTTHAQVCAPAGVTTNPADPEDPFLLNNLVNPVTGLTDFTVNPFLNTFDWGEIAGADFKTIPIDLCATWEFGGNIILPTPSDPCPYNYPMFSPFSDGMPSEFDYLKKPANGLITYRDYHWEDGWELLWMNLGYLPNGTAVGGPHSTGSPFYNNNYTASPPNIPYLILYNRYRGIMRVTANVWSNLIKYQDLRVTLTFADWQSNLTEALRPVSNFDRPLSMPTASFSNISPRFQSVADNQWIVADFQIGYDPCTCLSQGKFDIEFEQITSMDINMIGREIGVTHNINQSNYTLNDFMNLSEVNPNSYKPGTMIYRSMDDMIQEYQTKLDKYDDDMNDYNSLGNTLLRSAISSGQSMINSWVPDSLTQTIIGKSFKEALAYGVDYGSMEFLPKVTNKPAKPSSPSATYTETAFKGTIESTYLDKVTPLFIPGTFPNAYGSGQPGLTQFNYPAYNEILGQFALLQKPKLLRQLSEDQDWYLCLHHGSGWCNSESTNPGDLYPGNNYVYFESEHSQKIWFKLQEPLKFTFNPVLDFDYTSVKVAFILTYKGMDGVYDQGLRIDRNLVSENMDLAHWFRPCQDQRNCENTIVVETDWRPAGDAFHTIYDGELIATATGDEVANFNYLTYEPDNIKLDLVKIEMKLLVDMYFDQPNYRGTQNNVTQFYTYLLWENNSNATPFETTGTVNSASLAFLNQDFDFGEVNIYDHWWNQVNKTSGNVKSIRYDRVFMHGLSQSSGNDVYSVEARDYIQVLPGAHLLPKGQLLINDPLAQYGMPVSQNFVNDFCQANLAESYLGDVAAFVVNNENNLSYSAKNDDSLYLNTVKITPNPANSQIRITSSSKSISEIEIFDLSGRSLIHQKPDGADLTRVSVNVGALQSGVYIVKARCENESSSQKLMIGR